MDEASSLFAENCIYEDTLYPEVFRGREEIKFHLNRCAKALPSSFAFVVDSVVDGTVDANTSLGIEKNNIGIKWHVEANGSALPFTRGLSFYVIDENKQIISGFDIPEPTTKLGTKANSTLAPLLAPLTTFFASPPKAIAAVVLVFYVWLNFLSDIPSGYSSLLTFFFGGGYCAYRFSFRTSQFQRS